MKRVYSKIITLIICGTIVFPFLVNIYYSQAVEVYTYNVNFSEIEIRVDSNYAEASGYNFDEIKIETGTPFDIEGDYFFEHCTPFLMIVGDKTKEGLCCDTSVIIEVISWQLLPMQIITPWNSLLNTWNQTRLELGPIIREYFFVPKTMAVTLSELSKDIDYFTKYYTDEWIFTQFNATFTNNTDIAQYILRVDGQYINTTADTNFDGMFEFAFAYNQTNGILLGYRIDCNYSGKVNGHTITFILLQEVEISNYDLPSRRPAYAPGFGLVISIVAIIFTVGSLRFKKIK